MEILITGGGLAGLSAALFLGRSGHQVTILERDTPWHGEPQAAFFEWQRGGVPQARQPHTFLAQTVRVLQQEAPDLVDDLLAAGVYTFEVDLGEEQKDFGMTARRLVYESVVRKAVEREPNVTIRSGCSVQDLIVEAGEVPIIRGVVTSDGTVHRGDWLIDAAGRRSLFGDLLLKHGARPFRERGEDCGLMYVSRYFRLLDGQEFPRLDDVPVMNKLEWCTAIAFPADNRTFALLATISSSDPLRRALLDEEVFARFHRAVPSMAEWLKAGEPISKVRTMTRLQNRYVRVVDENGPIAGGLSLIGDATMHTNPTAGRGVPIAFMHAQRLRHLLANPVDPFDAVVEFDRWTHSHIGVWFDLQHTTDTSMSRRLEAAVRGEPAPDPTPMERRMNGLFHLATKDPSVAVRLRRLRHMVDLPHSIFQDSPLLERAEGMTATPPPIAKGPTRQAFADSLHQEAELSDA
ncbi:MAG: hypothetical protein NVSMB57_04580 [Actinomycetota bacterium]